MKKFCPLRAGIIPVLLMLCVLGLAQRAAALDPAKSFSQYKQIFWNEEKGLPVNLVTTMTQTRDGYIWFGTQEGLVRFNGVSFKVFEPNNSPTLKGKVINQLYEDRTGRLWVATNKGLHLYQSQNDDFRTYTTADGLAKDSVNGLYEDSRGCLWIGTIDAVNCLKDEKITSYDIKGVLPNGRTRTFGESADGELWIGTSDGLALFRDNQFTVFGEAEGLTEKFVRIIYRDVENTLWIGTDNGLFRLENGKFIADKRFEGKIIRSITNDKAGALWIGGGFGVSRIFGNNFATMESRKELPSGVYWMFEDTEGCFWLATENEGIIQFTEGKFVNYSTADGLLNDVSYSIFQNGQKDIWIGTQKGINRFRNNVFDLKISLENGLPNTRFGAINADNDGNLWIGSPKGILRWQNNRLVNLEGISGFENLTKTGIQVIYQDPENNLWIGTNTGLSLINGNSKNIEMINFNQPEQLAKMVIYAITGSLGKGLWIGTTRGLFLLKNNQLTHYTTKDGLAEDTVLSLYEDETGVLWIGSFSSGLSRLKDNKIAAVNARNGLFNDTIFAILPDEKGNLWTSSNRGISRTSKRSIEEFIDGKRQDVDSIGYGLADGMKSAEANGGFQPAALRAADGKLWFPTVKGVVVIDPNNISTNRNPPPVRIESMSADSAVVAMDKPPKLPAGTQRLEFQFAALSFVAPEKNRYRYRLEGYDTDWIDAENRREAFYTNLPHGNYTFQVIAANNDGVWNEAGANFAFQINPYFYQTWWFLAACVFAVGAVIAAFHFRRVRVLRQRHEAVLNERYRIARELHDTLLQGFVGVSSQLSVVGAEFHKTPEIAERHLKIARDMIRHSVSEARRSVQNLRTSGTEDETFGQTLDKTVKRVKEGSDLQSEIIIQGTPFEMPPEIRHHLLLIIEEATVNTIKHAAAANLKIICGYDSPRVRVEIIDDGKGFDTKGVFSTLNGHFGMIGMKERAETAGGELRVEENEAGGTKVIFESSIKPSKMNRRFAKLIPGFRKSRNN